MKESTATIGDGRTDGHDDRTGSEYFPCRWPEINNTSNEIFHIEEKDIKNIFHEINPKKSTGVDQIPPKLVKLSSDYLIAPITKAVNSSIRSSTFPDNAKIAVE